MILTCIMPKCGKTFVCKPHERRRGRRFCSRACYYEWRNEVFRIRSEG